MGIKFTQGSGVNDSVFGKCQTPIKMFVEKKAEAWEQESAIKKIFAVDKSENFAETFTGMTSLGGFKPVGEGGAYPHDEMQEGYSKTIQHETFKDSFTITKEMVEDSKMIDFKSRPAAFISAYYRSRENFGASLIGAAIQGLTAAPYGGKSFNAACNDGLSMFNTAHTSITGGATQSNRFTNTFSVDNLSRIEEKMQGFSDDNGNPLGITPDTIIIPNHWATKKAVFGAIGADKDPATSNNAFNYQFGRWNVIVWQYLNNFLGSETAPWILADSNYNETYGGAVWLDRVNLTIKSTVDDNTDDNVWRGRARWSAGFNDWRAFAVGGVTSGTTLA